MSDFDSYEEVLNEIRKSLDDIDKAVVPLMPVFCMEAPDGRRKEYAGVAMIIVMIGRRHMLLDLASANKLLNTDLLLRNRIPIVLAFDLDVLNQGANLEAGE